MLSSVANFLTQFLNPLALVAVLLFIGLFLIYNHPKGALWLVLISLLVVAVFGNTYFSAYLSRSMEWRHMPPSETPHADVIVVLAAGVLPADSPRQALQVNADANRELEAARLYHAGAAPVILLSGGQAEVAAAKTFLEGQGVPSEALLLQDQSTSLQKDAQFSKVLITEKGYQSLILITAARSMDRALYLFDGVAGTITADPVEYTITLTRWENLMRWDAKTILKNLLPDSGNFQQTTLVLREYAGMLIYRLRQVL